jgi:hypothetical protein
MATHRREPEHDNDEDYVGNDDYDPDEELEGARAAVDKHNARVDRLHDRDDEEHEMYTEAELTRTLQEFSDRISDVDELPGFQREVSKALDALQARITDGNIDRWQLQDTVAGMQKAIRHAYHDGRHNRRVVAKLAWMVDRLGKALLGLAKRQTPANPALPLAQLTKSVTAGLGLSHAGEVRAAALLKSWFGAKGGQSVKFDRELCAKLRLAKALSMDEENRWRKYQRLPDDVDIHHPQPRASVEASRNVSVEVQQVLAGLGASPLVFPHLARRR